MWQYQNTDELYHHGVPGQRWGFRRYQNKDGSLTPAGRRRANKLLDKYEKVTGKKIRIKDNTSVVTNKNKSLKDMTNQELQEKINRKRLEEEYKRLYPERVSLGKKFMSKISKDVVVPAATNAARTQGEKFLNKVIGDFVGTSDKKTKDPMDKLRKEVNDLTIKKQKIELDEYFTKRTKSKK